MLLAAETNSFAVSRKTLRVSNPTSPQRSTYYLQIPYRFGVPLMIAFGSLHWLLSQSVFLVKITVSDKDGVESSASSFTACGWSAVALAVALLFAVVMMLAVVGISWKKYHPGMPIMRSCSRAIAAACHPLPGDGDAAYKSLMYGVVGCTTGGVEHAAFSSKEVKPLQQGVIYG